MPVIHQFRHVPSLNGVFALLLAGQLVAAAGEASTTTGTSAAGPDTGAAAVKLAELTGRLRVGAEYFLNRSDTRETVFRHLRGMADHGLSVVRIFVIWDDAERVEGQWDFSRYDWIYEAAKNAEI